MMTPKQFEKFRAKVTAGKLDPSFASEPVVAVLAGPAPVIEVIVAEAVNRSKIPMDWGYSAGRAFIHAKGDRKIARRELFCAMCQSDLSQMDL